MNRRRVLALLGVAGTGGCLRLSDDGGTSASRTRPQTAATSSGSTTAETTRRTSSTETESRTTTEAEPSGELTHPSGLSADGVGEYFPQFHHSALQAESFRAEWSKVDKDQSEIRWRRTYESDGSHAVGRATTRTVGGPADLYRTNTGSGFWREDLGSGYTYGRDSEGLDLSIVAWGVEVGPIVKGGAWSAPERVNDDRPAAWEVTADGVRDASAVPGHFEGELLSLSGSIRIDERGFIRELEADYRIRESNGADESDRNFRSTFSVGGFGKTSVERPSWVAEARDRSPKMSAALLDGGSYVRLRHDGGNAILADAILSVYDDAEDATYDLSLDSPIRPDETVHLYPTDETTTFPSMGISRGSTPDTTGSMKFGDPLDTWARRATLLYFKTDVER